MSHFLIREVMNDYFVDLEDRKTSGLDNVVPRKNKEHTVPNRLPISPKTSTWQVERNPRCLLKRYEFTVHEAYSSFLHELLEHETETGHTGKLICEYPSITVSVSTHDLDDITEIDKEYAKTCDRIYEDVSHYSQTMSQEDD